MAKSGFVLAGFEALGRLMKNFMLNKKGRWNDNFTQEQLKDFFRDYPEGFLYSYAQYFTGKKRYNVFNASVDRKFLKCRETGFFDESKFFVDSGGFQISIGRMTEEESKLLPELYYDYLVKSNHIYQRSVILDIPPGPGCKIYNNFNDVYENNLKSYLTARNLPDDVRSKMIYIHHFRTPKLWEIYTKIMRENELFPAFEYHGTGGIVANLVSDMIIPCIVYIIPLVPLLLEAKKYKRDYLNFHILGGANFRDVTFYELFKKVVADYHGIELNITYDSSGLFKSFMVGRYLWFKHPDGHMQKTDLRSLYINKRFCRNSTIRDRYQEALNHFADSVNFKRIDIGCVYDDETETLYEDVKMYSMLYMLHQWAEVQQESKEWVEEVYPLYRDGKLDIFSEVCMEKVKSFNSGRVTKKSMTKGRSVIRSLDILKNLDENYCKYIVDTILSKDEFSELDDRMRVMTI